MIDATKQWARLGWFWMVMVAAGCGDGPPPPPPDLCASLTPSLQSGNEQLAPSGATLAEPLTVQLVDSRGDAVAESGCELSWSINSGDGTVAAADAQTDASGLASAEWTLGPAEGGQTLRITVASSARAVVAVAVALDSARAVVFAQAGSNTNDAGGTLYLMNPDGSGRTQLTSGRGLDKSPKWSPGGKRIAFIRRFHESCTPIQGDVMVLDLEERSLTRLTDDGACAESERLSWSPDGESVVFERDDDLRLMDLATGQSRILVEGAAEARAPSWSATGVAFAVREDGNSPFRLHLVDPVDGATRELRSGGSDFLPGHRSTGGSKFTVHRKSPAGSLNYDIGIYDVDADSFSPVAGTDRGFHATFSPDGSMLIATMDGSLPGGPCAGAFTPYLVTIDLASGDVSDLTEPCGKKIMTAHWRPTG